MKVHSCICTCGHTLSLHTGVGAPSLCMHSTWECGDPAPNKLLGMIVYKRCECNKFQETLTSHIERTRDAS